MMWQVWWVTNSEHLECFATTVAVVKQSYIEVGGNNGLIDILQKDTNIVNRANSQTKARHP